MEWQKYTTFQQCSSGSLPFSSDLTHKTLKKDIYNVSSPSNKSDTIGRDKTLYKFLQPLLVRLHFENSSKIGTKTIFLRHKCGKFSLYNLNVTTSHYVRRKQLNFYIYFSESWYHRALLSSRIVLTADFLFNLL